MHFFCIFRVSTVPVVAGLAHKCNRARVECDAESLASLYAGAKSNLGDRVLGEVGKNSFITLPDKGGPQPAHALKILCPNLEEIVRSFI